MDYIDALKVVHAAIKPRFYVEIGCRKGSSLALADCPRLAVDPDPELTACMHWPTRLYRETSDAFFARPDAAEIMGQSPDLAFIDGMHLVEFALRDFINLEAHSTPDTVIAIDDVAPGDITWASRERETQAWTGDVYQLIPILNQYRPDLKVAVFNANILTFGKGLAVIHNLDPGNTVLSDSYDEILARIEAGDFSEPTTDAIHKTVGLRPADDLKPYMAALADRTVQAPAAPSATALYLDRGLQDQDHNQIRGPVAMRSFETPFPEHVMQSVQRGVLGYTYKGIPCLKSPIDMAIYMKLLWDLQPGTIIEVGSKHGGSAVYFADLMQTYGLKTHVYSIDLETPPIEDERITFLEGDVNHLEKTFAEHGLSDCPRPWYVNEDSAHTYEGCLAALRVFAQEMKKGDVLAMEDGNLVELGLSERYQGGPNRAITEFFEEQPDAFEIATDLCDMFGTNATYNPNGYMRKT